MLYLARPAAEIVTPSLPLQIYSTEGNILN